MNDTDYRQTVLAEIVAAIGTGPELTMDQIGSNLGELYAQHQQAGDHTAMVLISEAWGRVNQIANAADMAITVAAAAREMVAEMSFQRDEALMRADEMVKERDAAQEERNDIVEALESCDIEHPHLSGFAEMVTDMVWDDAQESGVYVSSDPADDIINNAGVNVTRDQAEIFHHALTGDRLWYIDEGTADALLTELARFITQFVRKVADAETKRAAQMASEDND